MGLDYQMWRASVNVSKGYRQFVKAQTAIQKNKVDSGVSHLKEGLKYFTLAIEHGEKAEDDAYAKASTKFDQANKELQKSIDEYSNGKLDSASKHYAKALDECDQALDLID